MILSPGIRLVTDLGGMLAQAEVFEGIHGRQETVTV